MILFTPSAIYLGLGAVVPAVLCAVLLALL